MANTKISDLTAIDSVASGDEFAAADTSASASKKVTAAQIATFMDSVTQTLTNKTFDANATGNSLSNVDVADLSTGTDGELITWDSSGNPTTVAAGTSSQVLTSNGAGAAPTFQAAAGGGGDVVDDTTPQLGGQLDVNGNAIGDGTLELLTFTETLSAVNHVNITNATTTNSPTIAPAGDDANVGLIVDTKGTGTLTLGSTDSTAVVIANDALQIGAKIEHTGDATNEIRFGSGTQAFDTGGSTRIDISNSGVRFGDANARVTTILDEDTMSTDSATALATQQSIKAYVDSNGGSKPQKEITWLPGSFESNNANPASLEFLNGTNVDTMVRAFDDTTAEYVEGKFVVPGDINTSGTVTLRTYSMAKTAAASKNVEFTFEHLALNDAEDFDPSTPYTSEVSGDLVVDSTQDNIQEDTWTETVTNLGWAANDIVLFRLSRTEPSANDLTGDHFLFSFTVEIPRS